MKNQIASIYHSLLSKYHSDSLKKRFIKGAIWSSMSAVISQGAGMLVSLYIGKLLGVQLFGEFATIRRTTAMFGILSGFGLGLTTTKYIAEFRDNDKAKAGAIWQLISDLTIFTSFLAGSIVFFTSPWLSAETLKNPDLCLLLRIGILALVFEAVVGVQRGVIAGFEEFRYIAVLNFINGLLNVPVMFVCVYFWSINGAVLGVGLVAFFTFLSGCFLLRKCSARHLVYKNRKNILSSLPIIWNFSLPVVGNSLVFSLTDWLCTVIVVNQVNGYFEMGLFNAAFRWTTVILFIPMAMSNPALSLLSNIFGLKNYIEFKKLILNNLIIVGSCSLVVSAIVFVFARFFVTLYGQEYGSAANVLRLLCIMVVLRSFLLVLSQGLAAMGKAKTDFAFGVVRMVVQIAFLYVFINMKTGAIGLALALILAYVFQVIVKGSYIVYLVRKLN